MQRYNNFHKHTHYSNIRTLDCVSKPIDYINRAVELGHTTYFTGEHGFQGNIFEAQTLCEQNNLKCIYSVEAYYVDDMYDKSDRINYHIMLIAMTENARKEINSILSKANTDGFYYKPRIDLKCLLSLTPTETIITTACVAGRMFKSKIKQKIIGYKKNIKFAGYDDDESPIYIETEEDDLNNPIIKEYVDDKSYENDFLIPVYNHFKENFYLEVQSHNEEIQKEYNKKIIEVAEKYHIKLIHANDSHYIRPEDSKYRDLFLRAKGINYEDESNFILDYPDYDTIVERYKKQGILTENQIYEALNNTLIFDKADGINIDKEFKIPKVVEGDSNEYLKNLLTKSWSREKANVKAKRIPNYLKAITYEYEIVKNCGMADYFILDSLIVNKAVNEYNAVLTRSGRGSAVSFYINKLLGLTEVDRIKSPITLYPTRFMSAERILSSRSLPDIDLNFADVTPVIKSSKDILGDDGIYYMVAYKPLQESSAFRLWCKSQGLNIDEYDEVAKNLELYETNSKWRDLIEQSKIFRGVIESIAPSPCSFLLSDKPISQEIGLIKVGDIICCALDGYQCDCYKFLKNDYLTVKVYDIIDKVYNLIGRPIDDISTLVNNCDDKVWEIYEKGLTTTINQSDSDFGKQTLKRYKPKSLAEMSAWVAAIRPGFASLLNNFLDRLPYTTGVEELDTILEDSFHYMIYQESIMKYLVWLGIEEKGTYDIIKKIAKKKFKEEELNELKILLKNGWIKNVGSEEGFEETWQVVNDAAKYSFNASHSLSVAIDSIYGAYLKSHYPLEYFTVVLSMYSDDMDRTAKLINELPYFNITLNPIKYGKSKSNYAMDKKTNSIYKGISSIKYCNQTIAEELFQLSQDFKTDNFIELLTQIKQKTSINSRQLKILITLNFFSDFGCNGKLLKISELYDNLIERKQIKKADIKNMNIDIEIFIKYVGSETEKMYKDLNMIDYIYEISAKIEDKPLSIKEQISAELEYLEYIDYINPKSPDNFYYVMEYKTYKDKCKPYVTLYHLKTGDTIKTKVTVVKDFLLNPFTLGSVLNVLEFKDKEKMKMVNGSWEKTGEFEKVLKSWEVY